MARQRAASAALNASMRAALASGFFSTPSQVPSGNGGGETALGGHEIKSVREQAILVGGKKRRAGEQAEIHGVKVVAKTGQGDLGGLHRAAGGFSALANGDFPALAGEMKRGG